MNRKQILVVDDDPDLLFLVAHGIKRLSPDYQVTTVEDGESALEQMREKKFDLVVTDYMMPGLTGLEVIEAGRKILPEALFITMTAYHETHYVGDNNNAINTHGFVSKPFTMPDLLAVVKQTLSQPEKTVERHEESKFSPGQAIRDQVQRLQRQSEAQSVLLINSEGRPIYGSGYIDQAKAARLAAFISSNFVSIAELATLFDDNESTFNSSYYQGNKHNIYAYDINGDYFLAVVFGVGGKPGTIWYYTKQAAKALAELLPRIKNRGKPRDNADVAEDL